MKIQLKSLRVINAGPLRDFCIEFNTAGDSPVTVIAGANGSGKTTILDLIVGLAEQLSPKTQKRTNTLSKFKRAEYAEMNLSVNSNDPVFYNNLSVYYEKSPAHRSIEGWSYGIPRRLTQYMPGYNEATDRLLENIDNQQQLLDLEFNKIATDIADEQTLPSILYFPYLRFLQAVYGKEIKRESTDYNWVYRYESTKSFASSLDSLLIWLDYAEPKVYEQVIEFLNGLDFDGKTFGVQRKELRAVVTTRDGQTHGVAELSSGEQNILIMLLELRRRLLPYSIVLIDEIENSLHPAFQHRLAQGLKRMQEMIPFQLIVTTHSPLFARIFGPETVRLLTEF